MPSQKQGKTEPARTKKSSWQVFGLLNFLLFALFLILYAKERNGSSSQQSREAHVLTLGSGQSLVSALKTEILTQKGDSPVFFDTVKESPSTPSGQVWIHLRLKGDQWQDRQRRLLTAFAIGRLEDLGEFWRKYAPSDSNQWNWMIRPWITKSPRVPSVPGSEGFVDDSPWSDDDVLRILRQAAMAMANSSKRPLADYSLFVPAQIFSPTVPSSESPELHDVLGGVDLLLMRSSP